jgi:hypothetical protein
MLRAMLHKELRETLGLAGLGLLAYLFVVTGQMGMPLLPWLVGGRDAAIPFVGSGFLFSFCVVSVLLAVALGFRQSVAESVRGTWLLLLHRPAGRGELIGVKLAVGAVVYLICAAVPIVLYALWAGTPGTHASPFEWSMTLWSWQAWASIATLYFGAFLAGVRPARWFGSRLFPLAGAALLIGLLQALPWLWVVALGLVVLDVWLVVSILYVVRTRDF